MKTKLKRILCVAIAFCLCVSLIPNVAVPVNAAETVIDIDVYRAACIAGVATDRSTASQKCNEIYNYYVDEEVYSVTKSFLDSVYADESFMSDYYFWKGYSLAADPSAAFDQITAKEEYYEALIMAMYTTALENENIWNELIDNKIIKNTLKITKSVCKIANIAEISQVDEVLDLTDEKTLEYIEKCVGENFFGQTEKITGNISKLYSGAKTVTEVLQNIATYSAMVDLDESTKQWLEQMYYACPDNADPALIKALSDLKSYSMGYAENFLTQVSNAGFSIVTFSAKKLVDNCVKEFAAIHPITAAVVIGLQSGKLLCTLCFDTDDLCEQLYLMECIHEIQSVARTVAETSKITFINSQTHENAVAFNFAVDCYFESIIDIEIDCMVNFVDTLYDGGWFSKALAWIYGELHNYAETVEVMESFKETRQNNYDRMIKCYQDALLINYPDTYAYYYGEENDTSTSIGRTLDSDYSSYLPIYAYPISTSNISVYDANGSLYSNRYITGSTDLCIIHAIYTDGWCYISYPSSAESDGYFEAYVKLDTFIGSTSAAAWTSTGNYTAYRRSDLSVTLGSVDSGDACLVVNTNGNLIQVIYPVAGSGYYKMGWIETSEKTPVNSSNTTAAPTVFYQTDSRWGSYQYGYSNTAGTTPATISSAGCGLLSYVNAVYYLNGSFIEPTFLADYSVNNGYRVNGVGTSHSLYKAFANSYGADYGFAYVGQYSSYSSLANQLQNGNVAIFTVPNHLMACVDYDSSTGKYLILDSYPSSNRGTSSGYAWKTQSQMESMGASISSYFYVLTSTGEGTGSGSSTSAHEINTAYSSFLPAYAYPISTGNISVYDVNGSLHSNRYITGSTDLCIIHAIYTDGWCYISYPSSAESDGYFEAYVKLDTFIGSTSTATWTSTGNYTAYRRSDLSATIGSVSSGDACLVVNTSGNLKQVIYPVTGSGYYKMGWINAGSSTTTTDSDFPTPILGYNYSASNRTTVYQYTSTLGGTSYGEIFVDDECTINSVSISGNWVNVTYPITGGTKTGYVYLDQFFPSLSNISKPYTTKVSANTTVYCKSDMATSYGTVYSTDTITVVGKSGSTYQILYPITEGSNAGKYKLGWIYGTNIVKNLTGISITTKPTKTVYLEGESFSTSGMVVTATYDDGSTAAVTGYTTSGYTSTPGSKTITITYGGKTTAIDVTVKSKSPTALTVTANPTKTSYFVGDEFDSTGMAVKATYDNGTSATVTDYFVSYDFTSAGSKTVLVEYVYNGVTVSTTLTVAVVEPTISSIAVTTKPSKTSYYVGDTLNTSGMVVTATYNDGSTEAITSGFACSPTTLSTAGTQAISVSYGGKTTSFTVSVTAVTLSSLSISSKPTKTTYYVGDTLDTTGLTLKATYNNGSTKTITSGITCTPTTLSTAGTQTITASYGGKSTTFTVTVKATPTGNLSVGSVTGEQGTTVTVPIKLTSNSGLIAARLKVAYNSSYLTLTKVEDGGILGEYVFGNDLTANPYVVMWENGLAESDFTTTGTLVYLTFKIADNAPAGQLPITVSYDADEVYNIDLENMNLSITQGAVTVEAAETVDPDAPKITVDSASATPGKTVTVSVTLENNPGIWGMDLEVNYDKTQLTLTNVTNGTVFAASEWTAGNLAGDTYILSYEASGFDNITANGVLAVLEFTVNETATVDSVTEIIVSYDTGDIINVSFDDISPAVVNGGIKIVDFVYGDLNGDGLVNKKDSLLMKMYLADNTTEIDTLAADVYADGNINKKDSLLLKQYLAGLDVTLGE